MQHVILVYAVNVKWDTRHSGSLTFTADTTTYYCYTLEEALKRAKIAGKRPGCWFGGITLKSGKEDLLSVGKG